MKCGLLLALLFTLVFTFPIFTYFDQPLTNQYDRYGDILLDYFVFEHNLSKITKADLANFLDTRMYYPLKNTWAFGNTFLPQSILTLPVYLFSKNAILATNSAIVINFFLSFLAMYALVYYLTKNIGSSTLAGLIFTFNPYVVSHIHQLELTAVQWIPLIFLFTEKLIKKVAWPNILLLGSLLLIQLSSSTYYIVFIIVSLPIYFSVRIYLDKVPLRQFFHIKVLAGILIFTTLAFLYLKPFIEVKNTYQISRDLETVQRLSANPADFLFTTDDNRLYGWMIRFRDQDTQIQSGEHSLFPGITVYFLLGLSIYLFLKRKRGEKRSQLFAGMVLLISSVLLAFGPRLLVYLVIYYLIPLADSLRVISRFAVVSFFSAALIIGLSWSIYANRLRRQNIWLALVIILISLEYLFTSPGPHPISSENKSFYNWLNNQANVKVILELPIGNGWRQYPNLFRDPDADYMYLLYGTLHTKKIINGSQAVNPREKIILGNQLTINFPTLEKLEQLKNLDGDIIIVHRKEYIDPKMAEEVIVKLRNFGLEEVYKSEDITAFLLK